MQNRIKTEAVRLKYEAKDWEDAVRTCGEILEKLGCVEHRYIDAMVDTVRKLGPYIVIGPGLAMPHAKRSSGVLKSGISVLTLKTPVFFGNEDNDPVCLLIGLAGINDNLHLDLLSVIATVFEEEGKAYEIAKWDDAEKITDLFNSITGEVDFK